MTIQSPPRWAIRSDTIIVCLLLFCAGNTAAQSLEPRAYADTPVGLNFLVAGYAYSEGDVLPDPALPLEEANISIDALVAAYVRTLALGNRAAKFEVIAPWATASGTATYAGEPASREVSGFGDPRLRLSVNLFGDSARTLPQFIKKGQRPVVGASLAVTLPAGQYDNDKVVNIGTNRWSVKGELGVSKPFGKITTELAAAVTVFGDNDEFLVTNVREQAPLYSLQMHLIYEFRPALWCAVSGTWYHGGRTTVSGVRGNDLQDNFRAGAALAVPLNKKNSLKFYADTGVSTRIGGDFNTVGIAWQHRWGAAL